MRNVIDCTEKSDAASYSLTMAVDGFDPSGG